MQKFCWWHQLQHTSIENLVNVTYSIPHWNTIFDILLTANICLHWMWPFLDSVFAFSKQWNWCKTSQLIYSSSSVVCEQSDKCNKKLTSFLGVGTTSSTLQSATNRSFKSGHWTIPMTNDRAYPDTRFFLMSNFFQFPKVINLIKHPHELHWQGGYLVLAMAFRLGSNRNKSTAIAESK